MVDKDGYDENGYHVVTGLDRNGFPYFPPVKREDVHRFLTLADIVFLNWHLQLAVQK